MYAFGSSFIRANALDGRCLERSRLHLSLSHIGDYTRLKSSRVYAVGLAASEVSAPAFEVRLHAIRSFDGRPPVANKPRSRPLVLLGDGDGLPKLHATLTEALREKGLRVATRFTPHLTLSYGEATVPLQAIEPMRFIAKEFALVHSMLGQGRYNILGRWPLNG
ncbi:2'-5' RNA ligase family protein [Oryzicola mucosus]|uniref:2'-5' RNA ligase family protein n=1 Tax=Oryzicola mucosus TaxID=2767425 RepID=A0A8J6U0W3_9HYPH|nr:2'-5' RNA ligase family protein [Oryzicola mucosus]MBD0416096.1 2'-5' RNA ligase family protein [Oryzicola mucosus]